MTKSLCCSAETNTTVQINAASIKGKNQKKKHMMFPINTSIKRKANRKTHARFPVKTRLFASASVQMRRMNLLYRVK